jgi:hypothetical protein
MAKRFTTFAAASSGQRCTCAAPVKAAAAPAKKPALQPAPPAPNLADALKKAPFDRGGKK